MAFSMFLRGAGCKLLSHHMGQTMKLQLATLSSLSIKSQLPSSAGSICSIKSPALTHIAKTTTPTVDMVRSFRTSPVHMSEKPHDHARMWVIEKATSALLLALIPIGLMVPNKGLDMVLAILITAHSHWGLEAIAMDYVRASMFGPVLPKVAIGLVYLFSVATLAGLFYLITHDVGFANSIRQFWAVKPRQSA